MNKLVFWISVACVAYVGATTLPVVGKLFTVTAHALSAATVAVP